MTDLPVFILERTFHAKADLVWQAWTTPEHLVRWYGPKVETIVHKFDLAKGGLWLNEMKWGETSNYQRSEFLEVSPPEKLVFLQSITDAEWNIAANPQMPDWPRILKTTVTFRSDGEETHMRLEWVPHDATEAELACFGGALANLEKGWGAGMELLAQLLEELGE